MRAFLVTTGIIFSLLVIVHLARIRVEPEVARDPWFWGTTLISAALSVGVAAVLEITAAMITPIMERDLPI